LRGEALSFSLAPIHQTPSNNLTNAHALLSPPSHHCRYTTAIEQLKEQGQTQVTLLLLVPLLLLLVRKYAPLRPVIHTRTLQAPSNTIPDPSPAILHLDTHYTPPPPPRAQVMLIRLVQNKLAERVTSYAEQKIKTRLLFEAHDVNRDFVMDEGEFRICMEKVNVQLDDVQSLALFAYFDQDFGGTVNWQEFSDQVLSLFL